MGIRRTLYFLTATLALFFFTFAAQGEGRPFITRWKGEAGKELKIPIFGTGYKLVIKKASDNSELKTEASLTITENENFYTYTPTEDGDLLVEAGPEGVEYIRFVDEEKSRGSAESLLKVEKFGTVAWESMKSAFLYCPNMQFAEGVDTPDLSKVTDMGYMFGRCSSFNQPLNNWNVSSVTDMRSMFSNCASFNQPLNNWNVSNVTDMGYMFYNCASFNQPLNNWYVSKVTDMGYMFLNCSSFNQDLSSWDVSKVTNMYVMFSGCSSFNQDLSSWDVSKVTDMREIFVNCSSFNQDLSSWDVSKVTDMGGMFYHCSAFNQNLGAWKLKACRKLGLGLCGMSIENYSKSLAGWAAQTDIKENLLLDASNLHFNETAKSARTKLVKEKHWGILGDVSEGGRVYDIIVGGVQLNSDNIASFQEALTEAGVLKKGKVNIAFEGEKPVLTLENAELTAPYNGFPVYMLGSNEIPIQLQGVCTITHSSSDWFAIYVRNGTIVGRNTNDKLLVKGGDAWFSTAIRNCTVEIENILEGRNSGKLEIDNAVVKAKNIRNMALTLKNCSILQPEGAHYDETKWAVVDKDGNTAENVVIGVPITLERNQLSLAVGKDATLKANVMNLTNKEVEWSCDKTDVATVDNSGKVTAKAVGNATITAKTKEGGYTATCEVTVTPPAAVEDAVFASVVVSPNPFNALLRISNGDVRGKYTLYNTQGVEVALGVLEGAETRINTTTLPSGVYLLRLTAENGATKTFTVVKR